MDLNIHMMTEVIQRIPFLDSAWSEGPA